MPPEYGKRFEESTRGRVVELLRLKSRTVEELARELGLTDNAVRTHIATLERDGIVRQEGVRRGGGAGKPAWVYGIVPEAESRFSNAYVPLLLAILDELSARSDQATLDVLMRDAGLRLAAQAAPSADYTARLQLATTLLHELGARTQLRQHEGATMIVGRNCPVGLAVTRHPSVCRAIEALLESIIGRPVYEHCDRSGRPSCCFQIEANSNSQ